MKLALKHGAPRVLALQTELVFYLYENLRRSIVDGQFSDPRAVDKHPAYSEILEMQPTLTPRDFDGANATSTVSGWNWHVFKDGIAIEFQLIEGEGELYVFSTEVAYLLLDYVERAIEEGHLVDLRDFRRKPLHEMEEEIADSEGLRLKASFDHFDRSRRLLERNYDELKKHIERFEGRITDPDFVLWVRRHSVDIFMEETLRLLHNFVAACASLIDHSRIFYRLTFGASDILQEYQKEVDRRFVKDPISQFVIGLRQYAQHYRLPGITTVRQFGSDGIRGRVFLLKQSLLEFSRWNAPAREFIQSQSEEIDLLQVLQGYHSKVRSFHRWLQREWNRVHRRELHAAELKRQAFLAKRSEELVLRLRQRLQGPKPKGTQLLDLFSDILSAEELHQLRELENSVGEWVKRAVHLAGMRYLLPDELKAELLALGENNGTTAEAGLRQGEAPNTRPEADT